MKDEAWINYLTSSVSIEFNLFYPPDNVFT